MGCDRGATGVRVLVSWGGVDVIFGVPIRKVISTNIVLQNGIYICTITIGIELVSGM